jgi:glycosyltransferase involved in cell wall biosynthesis
LNLPSVAKKTKISIVVSDLSSSGSGRWGGAVRPFLLAQALKKLDYDVEIVGVAFNSDSNTIESQPGIIAIPCQYHSGFIRAAKQLLRKIDGDIIYAVKPKTSSFGLSLVKKLISRRPLILDIDDWELSWYGGDRWQYKLRFPQVIKDIVKQDGALRYPDHPLYLKCLESLTNRADAITLHTQFLQKRFGGVYVPNGKDTSLFDPDSYDPEVSRAKYGLAGFKILMFPGAPRPYKGLEDVLSALDLLNRSDLKLAIVGGSPYDDYDNQLIDKWGKWIVKLPRSPVDRMPEIVSAAHIIVVPQKNTPAAQAQFPLKLTDGMAMAKPILATRVGDIPEIVGDTGFLVDPSSPEQLAEKIEWIFANLDEANAKGREARERCIQYYSIENMAKILAQIFNTLV